MKTLPPAPAASGFQDSGFFVLRTPLLPIEELLGWGEGLTACATVEDDVRLEAALAADRALLRERLRAALARSEVREALFLASPSLDEGAAYWLHAPDSEAGQKVERALVRYWARMSGRSTPFGLFAGCTVGQVGPDTRLVLGPRQAYRRHARLDMDYVCALADALASVPALRESLTYRPNSSLYRAGGQLRYARHRLAGRTRSYLLVVVEPSDYLEATLARARAGASLHALAQGLADADPDISLEEALEYVGTLVDHQLLVPELEPAVSGPEPLPELLSRLRPVAALADTHARLEQARHALEDLGRSPLGVSPERYRALARGLEALPAPVELSRLFQVDMVKPATEAVLGPRPLAELARAVTLLHRLCPPGGTELLRGFRDAFQQRYEDREVPLVEALDEESGIGFGAYNPLTAEVSPLLEGLAFPAQAAEERAPWGAREAWLQGRVSEALRQGARELVLDARDVEALSVPDVLPLPDAFSLMATLLAPSEEALAAGDFQVIAEGLYGPSGATLLGRFCHADPRLQAHVEAHLRAEEALRPEVVYAELVHLPEGRIGNIASRPVLRAHEIVFLGRSGAEPERQLPITDLRVSIRGQRIVLRSASLGREVVPRLTNAHAFHRSHLRLYRFLGALQQQGTGTGRAWRWGALADHPFLPRLVCGKVILQRARWRLPAARLRALGAEEGGARFRAVQRLRAALGLPRFVGVEDSDNVLPVDLDNVLSVETFVHLVKERERVDLVELLTGPRCVQGPEGRFLHELVVPFVRTAPALPTLPAPKPARAAAVPRTFLPGSEWLYAKVYLGPATADRVLREAVRPLAREVMASKAADQWFFIRYGDPDWHLRLRFHGAPGPLHAQVLGWLHDVITPLRREGLVWRVQFDTYEREVERYGGPEGVLLAERLFHVDSEATLALLGLLPGESGADLRWRLTLWGIDAMLGDLGLDLAAKSRLMERLCAAFGPEFRVDGAFERQLGKKFRQHRSELEALLEGASGAGGPLGPAAEVLRMRSEQWAPGMRELRALEAAGRLTLTVEQLATSYIHMHANRMLRTAARAQELVLYDFLRRLYTSQAARQRQG